MSDRVPDRKPDAIAVCVADADDVGYVPVPDTDNHLADADPVDEPIVDPVAVDVPDVDCDGVGHGYSVWFGNPERFESGKPGVNTDSDGTRWRVIGRDRP